jgi:hypothetical protein
LLQEAKEVQELCLEKKHYKNTQKQKTFYCFKKDWAINIFGQQCNSWQSEAFIEMLVVRIFQHGKRNRKTFPQTGR